MLSIKIILSGKSIRIGKMQKRKRGAFPLLVTLIDFLLTKWFYNSEGIFVNWQRINCNVNYSCIREKQMILVHSNANEFFSGSHTIDLDTSLFYVCMRVMF